MSEISRKTRKYIKSSHRKFLEKVCVGIIRNKQAVVSPEWLDADKCRPFACLIRGTGSCGLKLSEIRVNIDPMASLYALQVIMTDGTRNVPSV